MRGAVEAAQQSAAEALDSLALEQRLAPVRKGARVLREIAWRLREIGNDGRICDLIDSQVAVIETGRRTDNLQRGERRSPGGICRTRGTAVGVRRRGPCACGRDRGGCALFAGFRGTAPGDDRATAAVQQASEALYGSKAAPAAAALVEAEAVLAEAAEALPVAALTDGVAEAQELKPKTPKPKTPKLMTRRSST